MGTLVFGEFEVDLERFELRGCVECDQDPENPECQ
jgi:hypothetical protein